MKLAMTRLVPGFVKQRIKDYVDAAVARESIRLQPLQPAQQANGHSDQEVLLSQLQSSLCHEMKLPPLPPKHLQVRVVGIYSPSFVESGYWACADFNRALNAVGKQWSDFPVILDFGCGCGRTFRALKTLLPSAKVFGTDIDPEAIEWLTANYSTSGTFVVAPHVPPTSFQDNQFDLVYGLSVFTHLPEEMQFQWLSELRRITKPGGYLVLTTHGEKHYKKLSPEIVNIMATKGFFYSDFGTNYGKSISLPDFYQTTMHSHDYIRREWSKYFEVLDIRTLGMENHQDTTLLRKRQT